MMVIGRKPEASDAEAKPHERTGPPPAHVDGRFRQPTDVTWDQAATSHQRRLRQFARRELDKTATG